VERRKKKLTSYMNMLDQILVKDRNMK